MTEVVAVDPERGWFLMRDAGTRLRELIETRADLHHWERLLNARLQIEVAPHAGELLALGVYLVFDWGDSCVSHPLLSLTVNLRSIAWRLELEPGGPELRRLRDIYLERFGRGPEIADIAYRVGTVARAIAWDCMVSVREPEFVDEEDLAGPAYGIKLCLAGGPIGTWQEP